MSDTCACRTSARQPPTSASRRRRAGEPVQAASTTSLLRTGWIWPGVIAVRLLHRKQHEHEQISVLVGLGGGWLVASALRAWVVVVCGLCQPAIAEGGSRWRGSGGALPGAGRCRGLLLAVVLILIFGESPQRFPASPPKGARARARGHL